MGPSAPEAKLEVDPAQGPSHAEAKLVVLSDACQVAAFLSSKPTSG